MTEEAPPCEERDWSELPQDLVPRIAQRILDLLDFVRFRAVCPRWRSAVSTLDSPRQIFWYVGRMSICSFAANYSRIKLMDLPELPDKWIRLRSPRYIVAEDKYNCSLSLINPLNGREIALPPINTSRPYIPFTGTDPIENCEYVIIPMSRNNELDELYFCKVGDETWKLLEMPGSVSTFTYFNSMLFVHRNETKVTEVIDVTTGSVQFVIPPPDNSTFSSGFDFFVVSCGKLLGIISQYVPHGYIFEIYELEYENGNSTWMKKNSIEDQFLVLRNSRGGWSLKANDYPGFEQNCIYYLEIFQGGPYFIRYDIENGSTKKLPVPKDVVSFFMPGLE